VHTEIQRCRICGNADLYSILDLGRQHLTGVFPRSKDAPTVSGPLELVKCDDQKNSQACGLVQLKHSYEPGELYGQNYGYRSGLNQSMVKHLRGRVGAIQRLVPLAAEDMVLDIGSNDSTLLQAYPSNGPLLVGIDPTGVKFEKYYPRHIHLIPECFSAEAIRRSVGGRKAKVVTSIAMFYDLEAPADFMRQVDEILAEDGVWLFEQSYMPRMLAANAYDTVCHEHTEYYGLKQIKWMADRCGLKIIDVEFNEVNGGSFGVMVAKQAAPYPESTVGVRAILEEEERAGLHTPKPYEEFRARVITHRDKLTQALRQYKAAGKVIFGYGASTKGNVLLQYCHLTREDIPCIAEVNEDKFGAYTPGTLIPIVSEVEARAAKPDFFLVLPWHFRENIVNRENSYLAQGGKLLFPLPEIEVVERAG
jgi:hypothetical protein